MLIAVEADASRPKTGERGNLFGFKPFSAAYNLRYRM